MPLTCRRLGSILICGVLLLAACAQKGATPADEQGDDQPPLIDRQQFFGDPRYSSAKLSPNGERVAFRKPYKGQMNIWVKGIDEPFDAAEPVTADTERPIPGYFWTQDGERILYVQDKGGNENFHIYAVDPDAEERTDKGVPPADDLTPYEDVRARIIDVPENTPGEIVVGLNDRNPQYHDVYRLDLATGERTLVYRNDAGIAGWVTDLEGNLRLATRQTDEGGTEILRLEGDELVPVYQCSFEETCDPVRFHPDGERVYIQTNKGPNVDLERLALLDVETGETEFVAKDPEGEVDFGGAIFNDRTEALAATVYIDERQRVYPQTQAFERKYRRLQEALPDGELSIASSTEDFATHIVTVQRDVDPGSAYLYDAASGHVERLYSSRPELPSEHLASMEPITYEARDGLTIPAYLTLPKGVEATDLPTIVMPHGGPWTRDTWGYDPYAQFFANRGYAVLQPNYRGSTGYGQAFLNAGNGEWGTGAMQHDVTDGVRHLVERGIADPERVGIYGVSYGGYAALAGLTFTPEVYAAGASYVGPSNLLTLLESIPPYWAPVKKQFTQRVGDPSDPKERERLKRQSPYFHAENIDDPLLVIQGAQDPRVKKQESDQIVVAARENGVAVQYLVAPEEGHGFRKEDNRLAVATELERFFGTHLGGRYQRGAAPPVERRLEALRRDVSEVSLPGEDKQATADGMEALNGERLTPADFAYEVQLEAGSRTMTRETRRALKRADVSGQAVWRIADTVASTDQTDTLTVERVSLRAMQRQASGRGSVSLTFDEQGVTGKIEQGGREAQVDTSYEGPVLGSSAHLEIALATLPLEPGYRARLPVFQVRQQQVVPVTAEVTGTQTVATPAGSFATYVVETNADGPAATGTYYVRRARPHHVIKANLEITTGGRSIRVTKVVTALNQRETGASE